MAARRHGPGWIVGLVCGALLAVGPAYALLLGGSLLPGMAEWLLRRAGSRQAALVMLLFGMAVCWPRVRNLWEAGGGILAGWDLLTSPFWLLLAWFAAAFGWALTELLPLGAAWCLELGAKRKSGGLRKARRRIVVGWDL